MHGTGERLGIQGKTKNSRQQMGCRQVELSWSWSLENPGRSLEQENEEVKKREAFTERGVKATSGKWDKKWQGQGLRLITISLHSHLIVKKFAWCFLLRSLSFFQTSSHGLSAFLSLGRIATSHKVPRRKGRPPHQDQLNHHKQGSSLCNQHALSS